MSGLLNTLTYPFSNYSFYSSVNDLGKAIELKKVYTHKKTGEKVFIKIGHNRKRLQKEYFAQKFFFESLNKKSKTIVPQPIELVNTKGYSGLVMEYVDIQNRDKENILNKVEAYIIALKFIEQINNNHVTPPMLFKKYSTFYLLLTIPYFFLVDVANGNDMRILLKSILKIALEVPSWLKVKQNFICHGDINAANVYYRNEMAILIDFGKVCLSHKYYDLANAVNSYWKEPQFSEHLTQKALEVNLINKEEFKIFSSFAIYNLLQRLSGKNTGEQNNFYLQRLNYFLNYEN